MHEARRNERIHEFLQKRQLLCIYSKSYFDIDQGIPQPMCVVQQGVGFESLHYFFFFLQYQHDKGAELAMLFE